MGALRPWELLLGCGLCTVVVVGVVLLIVARARRR
jgi:hypothetical protein